MAGVSAGTVDRILHGRGNVSEAKRQAVEAVLEKVGYKFNIHTSAVSLKRGYHFVITTPLAGEGDYWASVIAGITEAVEEYADIQILVDYCYYDQFDELSCKKTFDSIPAMAPDGVIIGPTFRKETLSLCQALDKKNIPYIFVDAHIEGTNPIASYSVNQEACGAFLGRMILAGLHEGEKILLFRSGRRSEERSSNTLAREKGLTEFLKANGLSDRLIRSTIPPTDEAENIIVDTFRANPQVQYAIVLNSRGNIIASAIQNGLKSDSIQLIGFDLTRDNIKCLEEGTITALLCQRPQLQGFSALRRLISWLLYRSREEDERHFLPIDLVVKENLPYYREM